MCELINITERKGADEESVQTVGSSVEPEIVKQGANIKIARNFRAEEKTLHRKSKAR